MVHKWLQLVLYWLCSLTPQISNSRHPYNNPILLYYQIFMLLCAILEKSFLLCNNLHLWPNPAKPLWEDPLPLAQPARERNVEATAKEVAGMRVRATSTCFSSFYRFPQLPAKASPDTSREQLKGRALPRRSSGCCRMEHPQRLVAAQGVASYSQEHPLWLISCHYLARLTVRAFTTLI